LGIHANPGSVTLPGDPEENDVKKTPGIVITVLVIGALLIAAEDTDPKAEALAHIDKARAELVAGDGQGAIDFLQKAIAAIQKTMEGGFVAFLPKPGEGWTAKEATSSSGNWGSGANAVQFTTVERTYIRDADKLKVRIQITNAPQIVQAQGQALAMLKNPQMRAMLAQDPNTKVEFVDEDGWVGLWKAEKGSSLELMAVQGSVLLTMRARTDDLAMVKQFWTALDRKGLAEIATRKKK
jgi:hypothetical protein